MCASERERERERGGGGGVVVVVDMCPWLGVLMYMNVVGVTCINVVMKFVHIYMSVSLVVGVLLSHKLEASFCPLAVFSLLSDN